MVGGVHYRNPGLWVKAATTLDVISGGRAWLGIGAAWNQAESEGLGFPWPSQHDRFEMLEDTLEIAHGMWRGERGSEKAFHGRHFHASRLLNVPQSISRPRVPIMIGGGGEKKTLRLVAKYADASNLFGGPADLPPKYAILAEHCAAVGRDFTEIERTNLQGVALSERSASGRAVESPVEIVERFGRLAEAGVQHVIISTADAYDPAALEVLGRDVLPQLRDLEAADPRAMSQPSLPPDRGDLVPPLDRGVLTSDVQPHASWPGVDLLGRMGVRVGRLYRASTRGSTAHSARASHRRSASHSTPSRSTADSSVPPD